MAKTTGGQIQYNGKAFPSPCLRMFCPIGVL